MLLVIWGQSIKPELGWSSQLDSFQISSNRITDVGMRHLADALENEDCYNMYVIIILLFDMKQFLLTSIIHVLPIWWHQMRISSKVKDSKHQQSYRFVLFHTKLYTGIEFINCNIGDVRSP